MQIHISPQPVDKARAFAALPPEWPHDPLPQIRDMLRQTRQKVVILDDDPTGTQTAHDVPVLTHWSSEVLLHEFQNELPAFFILTNTRSMDEDAARKLNLQIGHNLQRASQQTGRPFTVISRSDSTLRGHFPLEIDALSEALQRPLDLVLIVPAFMAGGRYTINNIHYVAEGEQLIPAAQTPFAQDHTFGYQSSDLRDWVVEKTVGRVTREAVATITLEGIRSGGIEQVYKQLSALPAGTYCVVNAVTERDLAVVAAAALMLERDGRHILYRTAASFASLRAGIDLRPVLSVDELNLPEDGGGLIVVGSYVPRTTAQLNALLSQVDVDALEVSVLALLDETQRPLEIARVSQTAHELLAKNRTVVIYSSRQLITERRGLKNLAIGSIVSDSLVEIVQHLAIRPRYFIAKGGITSSDMATKALSVKRAIVRGQILPGVPLWELGADSRYPDLTYIVFPGNVGDENALASLVAKLEARG